MDLIDYLKRDDATALLTYIQNVGDVNIVISTPSHDSGFRYVGAIIHQAIYRWARKCLQVLIDNGADIENKNEGMTPLLTACAYGRFEEVNILLRAGANVNTIGEKGGCLHYCVSSFYCCFSAMFTTEVIIECVKNLIDHGADPHLRAGRMNLLPRDVCVKPEIVEVLNNYRVDIKEPVSS